MSSVGINWFLKGHFQVVSMPRKFFYRHVCWIQETSSRLSDTGCDEELCPYSGVTVSTLWLFHLETIRYLLGNTYCTHPEQFILSNEQWPVVLSHGWSLNQLTAAPWRGTRGVCLVIHYSISSLLKVLGEMSVGATERWEPLRAVARIPCTRK